MSAPAPSPLDALPALGTHIGSSVMHTFKAFLPALAQSSHKFQQPEEYTYGPDRRHKVDIYLPGWGEEEGDESGTGAGKGNGKGKKPVMIFVHGGGMVNGDKRLPMARGGCHQNIGDFFAKRGFITAIPNYRLRIPDRGDSHYSTSSNAIFPSGGIDISLLLTWLTSNPSLTSNSQSGNGDEVDAENIFLMGNSAGAVHAVTYLYRDAIPPSDFGLSETFSTPTPSSTPSHPVPKAALLISMPSTFNSIDPTRNAVLHGYYNIAGEGIDEEEKGRLLGERCAVGLRTGSGDKTKVLVAVNELDPEDEILSGVKQFISAYTTATGSPPSQLYIPEHNHISTPLGLGLGEREEKWGEEVVEWCRGLM